MRSSPRGDGSATATPALVQAISRGKLDVAWADAATGLVVLAGKGDGTFQAPVKNVAGATSFGTASGDWNGDLKADLVVANATSNDISVFLNKGDGTFGAAVAIAAGTQPRGVIAGDWNSDGKVDLAVCATGAGKA